VPFSLPTWWGERELADLVKKLFTRDRHKHSHHNQHSQFQHFLHVNNIDTHTLSLATLSRSHVFIETDFSIKTCHEEMTNTYVYKLYWLSQNDENVTSPHAKDVTLQAKGIFQRNSSRSLCRCARHDGKFATPLYRLLLVLYDSQSSMIKSTYCVFLSFELIFVHEKRLKQRGLSRKQSERSMETGDVFDSQACSSRFIVK
jgi:hypothetical protein